MSIKTSQTDKLLVLCVDRDDDIGEKAHIKTPVIGREDCLKAATDLALSDPEEADTNSIFATIKQFDDLLKNGYECEIAIVAGRRTSGFESDKKIRTQIQTVISKSKINGVVFVSDGAEDEVVIPIIQNLVPVISIKRVIVKHSKSVEENYAILLRYLKMLIYDSRYSRFSLGVPGIFLLLSLVAILSGQERIVSLIALGLIGMTFLIRGFDIDKSFGSFLHLRPSGYVRVFSSMASVLIIATSFYTGFVKISTTDAFLSVQQDTNLIWHYGAFLAGMFIQEILFVLWIGIGIYFVGGVLVNYLKGSIRILGNVVVLIILGLLYLPVLQFSEILTGKGSTANMISFLLVGFSIIFLAVTFVYMYIRSHRNSQKEDTKILEE